MPEITKGETKIYLLYIIRAVPKITAKILQDGCLNSLYFDYFGYTTAMEELFNSNLIDRFSEDTGTGETLGKTSAFTITPNGEAILEDIENTINTKVKTFLDKLSSELASKMREENRAKAFIDELNEGIFKVTLILNNDDGNIIFSYDLQVSTRQEANKISSLWRASHEEIINNLNNDLFRTL